MVFNVSQSRLVFEYRHTCAHGYETDGSQESSQLSLGLSLLW